MLCVEFNLIIIIIQYFEDFEYEWLEKPMYVENPFRIRKSCVLMYQNLLIGWCYDSHNCKEFESFELLSRIGENLKILVKHNANFRISLKVSSGISQFFLKKIDKIIILFQNFVAPERFYSNIKTSLSTRNFTYVFPDFFHKRSLKENKIKRDKNSHLIALFHVEYCKNFTIKVG